MMQSIMKPTHLLYQAANQPLMPDLSEADDPDARCYLCGEKVGAVGQPTKERFGSTWTGHNTATAPDSQWLCPACSFCVSERAPALGRTIRMRSYSHLVVEDEQGRLLWYVLSLKNRSAMRRILLKPPARAWLLVIVPNPTGASHILHRAQVNHGDEQWAVMLGNTLVQSDSQTFASVLEPVEELVRGGFRRTSSTHNGQVYTGEIQHGMYDLKKINKFGVARWRALESAIAPHRGSTIFDLALFLAQKEIENEDL